MRHVKLDTTPSTNDFLKKMAADGPVENFTVVTAESQTKGRGQMGARWLSEYGKNLIVSIFISDAPRSQASLFVLNAAVANAVFDTIASLGVPRPAVKWPNDILSGGKKIGGILIETIFRSNGQVDSIVGIGLNVNQTGFEGLPGASSMTVATARVFDKEQVLEKLIHALEDRTAKAHANPEEIWRVYHDRLFRRGVPTAFEDAGGQRFMAIINGVSGEGKLKLQLDDESIKSFGIKEIKMLY
jgi:BirA family biotin operon repressor/biotin-[acetyl-CoA-carboxylase] ligase